MSEGETQEDRLSWCMDANLSAKEGVIGKSVMPLNLKRYGYVNLKEEMYLADSTLTRKTSSDVIR